MQAKPFLIDGQIVRSLLIFSFSESAVSAIDWLQQQPIQIALASALIGSVESLSAAEMDGWAIALLQTKGFDAAVIFHISSAIALQSSLPLLFSRHTSEDLSVLRIWRRHSQHTASTLPTAGDPHEALLQSIGFYS